jgi:4-amino-4-deoxy-L-arabinose transferase-like glycosyltransferase
MKMAVKRKNWFSVALILLVAGILMFTFLGRQPLLDPDEPVYAETAREMLQFKDFVSPRIYGDFWFDKPPLYYWLAAGAFKIFGVNEFAARFPAAFFAVSGVVLIYGAGRKLFSERVGLLAALALTTSLEYFYLGNAAVTDMTLNFFLTAALLAFLCRKYYLLYICCAFAVVTKGPVALFFCGMIISLYLIGVKDFKRLKDMRLLGGSILFALLALPWYVAMYSIHGTAFIETFLGFHNITRFLQPEHASGAVWYYYFPVLILGFFPWTAFLAQSFWAGAREKGENRDTCMFLLIWVSVVFLFFSFSKTKLISYILPLYPPLALLTGYYFDKIWARKKTRPLKIAAGVFGTLAVVLVAGLFLAGGELSPRLMPVVKILTAILIIMTVFILRESARGNFGAVFTGQVMGAMIFFLVLAAQVVPVIAPVFSVKSFAQEFKHHYDGQTAVYVEKFYRPGFMYYSGIAGVELSKENVAAVTSEKGKAYFIMKKKKYEQLSPEIQNKFRALFVAEDKILLIREN